MITRWISREESFIWITCFVKKLYLASPSTDLHNIFVPHCFSAIFFCDSLFCSHSQDLGMSLFFPDWYMMIFTLSRTTTKGPLWSNRLTHHILMQYDLFFVMDIEIIDWIISKYLLAGHCALLFHISQLLTVLFFFSAQVLTKGFGFHLRDLCNTTPLEEFVHIADRNVSRLTQEIICKSSSDWLNKAQNHFLSNLDFLKPIRVSLSIEWNTSTSSSYTVDLNFDITIKVKPLN